MRKLRLRIRLQDRTDPNPVQVEEVSQSTSGVSDRADGDVARNEKPAAKCMRKKREKLKQDPIAWAAHKAAEAERHRQRRKSRIEEQKNRDRETAKMRNRKYQAKHGKGAKTPKAKPVKTRQEHKTEQEYWRERQQACRARKSIQKKTWDKVKDRDRKRATRAAKKLSKQESTQHPDFTPQQGYSQSAKRKALGRLWDKLPSDPNKFAELVSELTKTKRLTPRKKAALEARGIAKSSRRQLDFGRNKAWENVKRCISELKSRRDDKGKERRRIIAASMLIEKRYRLRRQLARDLGVRPNYFTNLDQRTESEASTLRRPRSDRTCMDVIREIQDTYRSSEVSRTLPTMRNVKSDLKERRVMEVTVNRAYDIWKKKSPQTDVSLSSFQKLSPEDVLLQRRTRLIQCLCEYCTDIMLKLKVLNQVASACNLPGCKIVDKYELIANTVCPKENGDANFNLKCLDRNCDECGVKLLDNKYERLVATNGDRETGWLKWENRSYVHLNRPKTKRVIAEKTGTVRQLIRELEEESVPLAKHVFVANWQQSMYSKICKELDATTVVFVMDFAGNYACVLQDEIQSVHWATEQVTVHPIVAFYYCQEHAIPDDFHVTQEAIVIISNDLKHDAHAVDHFQKLALEHLREKRGRCVNTLVEFTDGCAAQYKSKMPFADISFSQQELDVNIERHFFGSRHGKGPSDGVSGVVKSAVRRAVVTRQAIINTAEAMFNYCAENLTRSDCKSQKRDFIFVKAGEINRQRPDREVKSALPGTRLLHAVRSVEPGVVAVRLLSCFCHACRNDECGNCHNVAYTPPWQTRALAMKVTVKVCCI